MSSEDALFFLTTPIYYVTAEPHIGHAYTTIIGDSVCRYERTRRGRDRVFYLTGTDEHGEKIERAAAEHGTSPQAFADGITAKYRHAWQVLHIETDDFIRTTEPRHEQVVAALWQTLSERGDIYQADYEGLYCVACESFYLEKDLIDGKLCPDHKREVELVREQGYFFRLAKYEQALLAHYAAHPDFIEPPVRMNEVRAFVERGLKDLSISRSSFSWGIKVPGDPSRVIYVWVDALTNYWSAMQEPPARRAFWGSREAPIAVHLMGKEITRFHAVYWPAMLLAAGLPLPQKIVAHGWWTVDGEKMGKTLGNVVDPVALSADIGADALRYFLLREVPLGADGDFSYEALIARYNSELCNDLGNLLNRTLVMVEKYSEGTARRRPETQGESDKDGELRRAAETARDKVEEAMGDLQPSRALEALFQLVRDGNSYVERTAYPFTRTDPEAARHALYNVLEVLRWLSLLLSPFLPERAAEMQRQLGVAAAGDGEQRPGARWPQRFGELPEGTLVRRGATLFPRIEADRKAALLDKWRAGRRAAEQGAAPAAAAEATAAAPTTAAGAQSAAGAAGAQSAADAAGAQSAADEALPPIRAEEITFDDFKRLDLRTARVLSAERVPKKDRLLKVELDVGVARRTVIAGLAEAFAPEELIGRTVLFLANLKPAKIGGVLSEGMILAVGGDKILALSTADRAVAPGTPVR